MVDRQDRKDKIALQLYQEPIEQISPSQLSLSQFEQHDEEQNFDVEDYNSQSNEETYQQSESEDLQTAIRSIEKLSRQVEITKSKNAKDSQKQYIKQSPEVIDDFIRNYLIKNNFKSTLDQFEIEWYELKQQNKLQQFKGVIPDAYTHTMDLEDQINNLNKDLNAAKQIATKASETWDNLRKERDFHRINHRRVVQEKHKLANDIKALKQHYGKYEPLLLEFEKKYEAAIKEKSLIRLDRDRVKQMADQIQAQYNTLQQQYKLKSQDDQDNIEGTLQDKTLSTLNQPTESSILQLESSKQSPQKRVGFQSKDQESSFKTSFPVNRKNPFEDVNFDPLPVKSYQCQMTQKAHLAPISNIAVHPTKPIIITVSDDRQWRMWHANTGELVMSGEGHKDWIAGVDIHPRGMCSATSSGDGTIKIWDFEKQKCIQTFAEHTQAIWSVAFHDMGQILASSGLDMCIRLWDLVRGKCRTIVRGHTDSVNEIAWRPYTSTICSASSDRTVSVWDTRTNLCCQTFYGHTNSVNTVQSSLKGNIIASGDLDGNMKLWDIRQTLEFKSISMAGQPINRCCIDRSGDVIAMALENGKTVCFSQKADDLVSDLRGHEDSVQACRFDPNGQYLVTGGADMTFRIWG